jgi:hypothetical protein
MVTLGVSAIMLASAVQLVRTQTLTSKNHSSGIESQQATRSSLDAMTTDIRLAGACLPTDGEFIALAGVDSAAGDAITIRTGISANLVCVVNSLTVLAKSATSTVTVGSTTGFAGGMLAYIRHPNGSGKIFPISSITATTITFGGTLDQDYPVASGVYALDERTYAIDKSVPTAPTLTLAVNRAAPLQFAVGVTDLQIQYVLDRNCPPCDRVNLPLNTTEWRLVNTLALTTTVVMSTPPGQTPLVTTSMAKPRNLVP